MRKIPQSRHGIPTCSRRQYVLRPVPCSITCNDTYFIEVPWYDLIFDTESETEDTIAPEVREHNIPEDFHACYDLSLDNENVDWQYVDVLARLLPLDLAVDRDRFTTAYAVVRTGVDFVGDDTSTITPPTPTLPKHTETFSDTASAPSVLDMIDALYDEADAALLDLGFVKSAPPAPRR